MKLVKESLLIESPDKIVTHDKKVYYATDGPDKKYAFEVILNKQTSRVADVLISSIPNVWHADDPITDSPMRGTANITSINKIKRSTYPFDWEKIYPGRLFMDPKVITFWVYPREKELKKIISIIEKKMGIQIMGNNWFIEVYEEGLRKRGKKQYANNYYRGEESKLIPIEKFVGSKRPPKKDYIQHLDSKHRNTVISGFGSKHPHYMDKRKWQMATVGMENKKEEFFPRLFE